MLRWTSFSSFGFAALLALACGLVAIALPNEAKAQHTTCMDMGDGMISCNTTPDMSHPQTGGSTTATLIGLIAGSGERSLRKKIGKLLADGDCEGAYKLALKKGRLELGNQIKSQCSNTGQGANQIAAAQGSANADNSNLASAAMTPDQLISKLSEIATKANAATPAALSEMVTVSKIEAIGTQILLIANVKGDDIAITDPMRSSVTNELCAYAAPSLLKAGASFRIKYFESQGKEIGSVMVTRTECGL